MWGSQIPISVGLKAPVNSKLQKSSSGHTPKRNEHALSEQGYGTRSAADASCTRRPAWVEVFMLVIQLVVLGCACSRRHLLLGHQWSSCKQATKEALGLGSLGTCSILSWLTVCHTCNRLKTALGGSTPQVQVSFKVALSAAGVLSQ